MAADDDALSLLGDPTRRLIVALLGQAPCSVTELAARLPVSRPAISQHLTLLKSCGLLRSHARGTRRIYEIDPERARALVDHLHRTAFPWPPSWQRGRTTSAVGPGSVVRAVTVVPVGAERAFAAFTTDLATWWPRGFHLGAVEPVHFGLEPWTGGCWYERASDGSRCDWGRIVTWDRPRRLMVRWEIDNRWQPDPACASEVTVLFHRLGPDRTAVKVAHRGFDRMTGGAELHQTLVAGGTWDLLLARFDRSTAAPTRPSRTEPIPMPAGVLPLRTAKGRPTQ